VCIKIDRGIAQSGSASGLGPEGREFKSLCPDHKYLKANHLYYSIPIGILSIQTYCIERLYLTAPHKPVNDIIKFMLFYLAQAIYKKKNGGFFKRANLAFPTPLLKLAFLKK
jgi:hypothetical protein